MNRAALFLNGRPPEKMPAFRQFKQIFCTDGAYSYLEERGVMPDVVCGDFDSIRLAKVSIPKEVEVLHFPDQEHTDFEKTLDLIIKRGFSEVHIYGGSGLEHDHFLGNLSAAYKYKDKITIIFFDDFSYFFFTEKESVLEGYKGRIISLYPFPVVKGVRTKGLQFPLDDEDLTITGRIGIRNRAIEDKVEITYSEGDLLVFIRKEGELD